MRLDMILRLVAARRFSPLDMRQADDLTMLRSEAASYSPNVHRMNWCALNGVRRNGPLLVQILSCVKMFVAFTRVSKLA